MSDKNKEEEVKGAAEEVIETAVTEKLTKAELLDVMIKCGFITEEEKDEFNKISNKTLELLHDKFSKMIVKNTSAVVEQPNSVFIGKSDEKSDVQNAIRVNQQIIQMRKNLSELIEKASAFIKKL